MVEDLCQGGFVFEESRHEQHWKFGKLGAQLPQKLNPPHLRHVQIGDNEGGAKIVTSNEIERVASILHFEDGYSARAQVGAQYLPNCTFVINDQDGLIGFSKRKDHSLRPV